MKNVVPLVVAFSHINLPQAHRKFHPKKKPEAWPSSGMDPGSFVRLTFSGCLSAVDNFHKFLLLLAMYGRWYGMVWYGVVHKTVSHCISSHFRIIVMV